MLGVHLGNVNVNDCNFAPIVNSIRKLFGLWSNRNLSIFGKSVVVNTLILSKLWYVANIFSVPDQMVKDINQNISKFIWGNHRHIVNRHVLMLPRVEGGIGIQNIEIRSKRLQLKWFISALLPVESELTDWNAFIKYNLDTFDPICNGIGLLGTTFKCGQRINNAPPPLNSLKI